MQVSLAPHPLLDVRVFVSRFAPDLQAYAAQSPIANPAGPRWTLPPPGAALRATIRDVFRHAGFKPTGRAKPASEYLTRADGEGGLRPINFAVDVCNLVSLHSGLPISVVDLDLVAPPLSIAVAAADARYVFNPAGQTIDVGRLLCLHDQHGPCANAVKDSQRTKTSDRTRAALTVVWSSQALAVETHAAYEYYLQLLAAAGVETEPVACAKPAA